MQTVKGELFKDQTGRLVSIRKPVQNIVSLVPSQTELLFDLGLDKEVKGITKFCIHPDEWYRTRQRVGGTKDFKIQGIIDLSPDLILANKEENTLDGLLPLMERFPVWVSDISTLEDALDMIRAVGAMTDRRERAEILAIDIENKFGELKKCAGSYKNKGASVAYMIWEDPWMVAADDTFIGAMIRCCGLKNCMQRTRYPVVTLPELADAKPDFLFLSSEPYPFKEEHRQLFSEILPPGRVVLVDGEYFSWYGSRLKNAPSYFKSLLNTLPELL